jgi:Domain of unknown function (DUF6089)
MNTKLFKIFTFVLLLSYGNINAQYLSFMQGKVEAGFSLGASNFLGDLGGNKGVGKSFLKDNNIELTKAYKGAFVTYYPQEWIGFRVAFNQTMVEADDAVIKDQGGAERARLWRNLSFRSNIIEGIALVELLPTVFLEQNDYLTGKLRPAFYAGVGVFSYNPQANLKGEWHDLRPLHTEGQGFSQYPDRKEYKKTAINFPLGLGFKYYVNEKTTIGFEAIHRFTNTDYIDDVSTKFIDPNSFNTNLTPDKAIIARQLYNRNVGPANTNYYRTGAKRGESKDKDGYYTMAVKVGWRIGSDEESYNRKARRQVRCY